MALSELDMAPPTERWIPENQKLTEEQHRLFCEVWDVVARGMCENRVYLFEVVGLLEFLRKCLLEHAARVKVRDPSFFTNKPGEH